VLLVLFVASANVPCAEPATAARNPRKHLVLDSRIVDAADGLRLTLGRVEKDARNPLLKADKPWENSLNNLYPNVVYDPEDKLFKLWYKCVLADKDAIAKMENPSTIHDVGWFLLYAASKDGVAWERPELGLFSFAGSKQNNIVARDTPNVGVLRDAHDPDAARRFKMIYDTGPGQMKARFSKDGIHWSDPVVPEGLAKCGDTHNNAWWDERLGKYVLITRIFLGQRLVWRSESSDFLKWEQPVEVLRSTQQEGTVRQTYCMPAFAYGNCYVGFVMMYNAGSDRVVDCELVWSPDSVKWSRVCPGTPFIPRGAQGSYDSSCIYAQANPPVIQDGRLLIYYGGSNVVHRGWKRHCLPCLARLRADGFAAYEPADAAAKGTLTTKPMLCTGDPLRVSADAKGGALRVAVLDADGMNLDDCEPIADDVTDAPVKWKTGKDLSALKGKPIRLRFELSAAKLYAFDGVEAPQ
jgi:hypothetical protein